MRNGNVIYHAKSTQYCTVYSEIVRHIEVIILRGTVYFISDVYKASFTIQTVLLNTV